MKVKGIINAKVLITTLTGALTGLIIFSSFAVKPGDISGMMDTPSIQPSWTSSATPELSATDTSATKEVETPTQSMDIITESNSETLTPTVSPTPTQSLSFSPSPSPAQDKVMLYRTVYVDFDRDNKQDKVELYLYESHWLSPGKSDKKPFVRVFIGGKTSEILLDSDIGTYVYMGALKLKDGKNALVINSRANIGSMGCLYVLEYKNSKLDFLPVPLMKNGSAGFNAKAEFIDGYKIKINCEDTGLQRNINLIKGNLDRLSLYDSEGKLIKKQNYEIASQVSAVISTIGEDQSLEVIQDLVIDYQAIVSLVTTFTWDENMQIKIIRQEVEVKSWY